MKFILILLILSGCKTTNIHVQKSDNINIDVKTHGSEIDPNISPSL